MNDEANQANNNVSDKDAPKWDWVNERSSCSYPKIFQTLRIEVEDDIKTRNGLRPNNAPYEFSVEENGPEFTAVLQSKDIRKSITFSLGEHSISVRSDQERLFDVRLNFTKDGNCRFNVNEEEYDLWQVRRMALEDLFFPTY